MALQRKVEIHIRRQATPAEEAAIKRLAGALRHLPPHLSLFGWAGTLCVIRDRETGGDDGSIRPIASLTGVHCDGGDPYDGGDPQEETEGR